MQVVRDTCCSREKVKLLTARLWTKRD